MNEQKCAHCGKKESCSNSQIEIIEAPKDHGGSLAKVSEFVTEQAKKVLLEKFENNWNKY